METEFIYKGKRCFIEKESLKGDKVLLASKEDPNFYEVVDKKELNSKLIESLF